MIAVAVLSLVLIPLDRKPAKSEEKAAAGPAFAAESSNGGRLAKTERVRD